MVDIARNYENIVQRVAAACERAGRSPKEVLIVGAAKQVEAERIEQAVAAGLRHVGENYLQEALVKYERLRDRVTWHFIGHLQTNKVKQALQVFDWIHSLDRVHLAEEINRRAEALNRSIRCLVEVNIGEEASKSGVQPADLPALLEAVARFPRVRVVGLMAVPPVRENSEESRQDFRHMRELAAEIAERQIERVAMHHLSMGMTHDFEIAIEEGATLVRIGTGLFGPRQ